MSDLDATDKFGQHTNTCRVCRANLHDLCPEGIELMQAAILEIPADQDLGLMAAYDFEHPDEVAKRVVCATLGHKTLDHLGTVESTHGTKHTCLRCGKFWHGEPTPPEMK